LAEIGAAGKPTIMVFNKIDRLEGSNGQLAKLMDQFPGSVGLSAKTGEGLGGLIHELGTQLRPSRELVELAVPHGESAVIARLHEVAQVLERDYTGGNARFKARLSPHYRGEFEAYIVRPKRSAQKREREKRQGGSRASQQHQVNPPA
jgi:GTP-binding protein HflX